MPITGIGDGVIKLNWQKFAKKSWNFTGLRGRVSFSLMTTPNFVENEHPISWKMSVPWNHELGSSLLVTCQPGVLDLYPVPQPDPVIRCTETQISYKDLIGLGSIWSNPRSDTFTHDPTWIWHSSLTRPSQNHSGADAFSSIVWWTVLSLLLQYLQWC